MTETYTKARIVPHDEPAILTLTLRHGSHIAGLLLQLPQCALSDRLALIDQAGGYLNGDAVEWRAELFLQQEGRALSLDRGGWQSRRRRRIRCSWDVSGGCLCKDDDVV